MCQFINHVQIALADYYVTIWASAATAAITWVSARGTCGSSEDKEKDEQKKTNRKSRIKKQKTIEKNNR